MGEAVKETLCTHCIHRKVCEKKKRYLDIINSIDSTSIPFEGGYVRVNKFTDMPITVGCDYFVDDRRPGYPAGTQIR